MAVGLVLVFARPSSAQILKNVAGSSLFSGGAGAFSGPIISAPFGFRGFPSLDYFPGSSMPTIRGYAGRPVPNGPGVSSSNLFGAFYANPLAATQPGGFGAPLYSIPAVVNAAAVPTATVGSAAVAPVTSVVASQTGSVDLSGAPDTATIITGSPYTPGSSAAGPRVNLPILRQYYPAAIAAPVQAAPTALKPREDLQQIISRSSSLAASDSIRVVTDGATVVLRGVVADDHDRRLAEALVRLAPGVQMVRNELTVRGQ